MAPNGTASHYQDRPLSETPHLDVKYALSDAPHA